jgi:alpha-glucosidase
MTWTKAAAAVLLCAASMCAAAQSPLAGKSDEWWKHAVIYEIYPRSFQDTDGNGIGDLKGIIARLDYLHELGIDAIWLTPMYPSPGVDYGYDISDYTAIEPMYGTMADFDTLVAEAKKRGIRVLMDYVINHTSDQHPWFIESRSSRANPKRDWYIWRDGKGQAVTSKGGVSNDMSSSLGRKRGAPPSNWQSWFGHSAWQWDEKTRQYYYHYFYVQQPDLNWRNPEVRKAMYGVLDFWMQRGAAGFRIDAVSRLFEDPDLHDDPYLPGHNAYGDRNIQHKYTDDLPEVHDVLKEVRKVVDKYPGDPVLIAEADEPNIAALSKMYGNGDEVQLPMDFQIADVNELSAARFRKLFNEVENNPAHGQPEYFFSNHDQPRQWDRYGDGVHNDEIAKLMAVLELTTRGTPQMYYGEELGMRTTPPKRIEDVQDPIGKIGWPKEKGRDGERTPMQWDGSAHAGFTTAGKPWLPIPSSAATVNVEAELLDPNSILNAYKRLIALRRSQPALRDGDQLSVNNDDADIFAFVRRAGGQAVLVALNMSAHPRTIAFHLENDGVAGDHLRLLYGSGAGPAAQIPLSRVELAPFGALVAAVE